MSLIVRNALIALAITLTLVGTIVYAINYLNHVRIIELGSIEDQLSIDMLSLETQFSLLATAPCESATSSDTFISELAELGNRLSYTENQLGSDNPQVQRLKQRYSLLEIRDYLITKQISASCGTKPVTVLYFYSNEKDCSTCDKAGFALSYLRDTYPSIRVYSFDYHLDLGALKTLIAILKVKESLPAFVIQGKAYYGFTTLTDLEKNFPKGSLATSSPKL